MKRKFKAGDLALHCHHEVLVEVATEDQEVREKYITDFKPECEVPLRLKLIRRFPMELLSEEAWKALDSAAEAHLQAGEALEEAREAFDRAREALHQAREAFNQAREAQAWVAHNRARVAHNQAWVAFDQAIRKYQHEFEAIHAQVCEPDCPWNGRTIFP
jgi:ElaB/YqjD/DUF883 family membrane-anchored ribosome-binding protein